LLARDAQGNSLIAVSRAGASTVSESALHASEPSLNGSPGSSGMSRHALISLTTSVGLQVLNAVTGVLLARSLGPAGRGALAAALLWPGLIVAVTSVGLIGAVAYLASIHPAESRAIVGSGLVLGIAQSLVVVLAGYILIGSVLAHYGASTVFASRLYLLFAPASLLTLVAAAVLQGKMHIGAFNGLRLLVVASTVAGLVSLYMRHEITLGSVVVVYLVANYLAMLVGLAMLARNRWFALRPQGRFVKAMLTFGLKSHVGNLSLLANERADQALVSLILAPVYLGLYAVAGTFASAVVLVGTSLAIIALPFVGSAQSEKDRRTRFAGLVRATVLLSAGAAAASFVAAPLLIKFLFGAAFVGALTPARILILAAIFMSTNIALTAGLSGFNRPLVPSLAQLCAAIITVVALAVLLPTLGIVGASIASLLAYAAATAYMVAFAVLNLHISFIDLLPRRSDAHWLLAQCRIRLGLASA
jgi:O-antigen/teichoic acid export membrane protein